MVCVTLTETGLLALVGLVAGFLLKAQHQVHQSRCNKIGFCGVNCERNVLSAEDIATINEGKEEEKVNTLNV